MTAINTSFLKPFGFILVLCSLTFSGFGQRIQTYRGLLQIGKLKGEALYMYKVVGADTVFDGSFLLKRSSLQELLKKNDSSFSIKGTFKDGRPEGEWSFQFGEFQTDSTTQVSGYQYQLNINGIQDEAVGVLNQGRPDGRWRFSRKTIANSKVRDTLFYSEINFDNGIPQQSFRLADDKNTLIGRFLRDGYAHDTWSLFSDLEGTSENWQFDEGILVRTMREHEGQSESVRIYEKSQGNFEMANLDEGFVRLLQLRDSTLNGIGTLILQNDAKYKGMAAILTALGSEVFYPEFKAKLPHYRLDEMEEAQLDTIVSLTTMASNRAQSLLQNTQLNLLKRSDDETAYLYGVVQALNTSFLNPLNVLVDFERLGIADNLSRSQLVYTLFPNGKPTAALTVHIDEEPVEETFLGPAGDSQDFIGNTMASLLRMATYAHESLKDVSSKLSKKLANDSKQQAFVELEESMITKVNHLTHYSDSVVDGLDRRLGETIKKVNLKAEELLRTYSQMENNQEKLDRAKVLVECLELLDALATEIASLPQKSEEIQEKYKDAVWNPFTATIMDEVVKRRIVQGYSDVLLPYLLDRAGEADCDNVAEIINLFRNLHVRMLALREEDTAKMERKLRKERNPEIMLQLFGVNPLKK